MIHKQTKRSWAGALMVAATVCGLSTLSSCSKIPGFDKLVELGKGTSQEKQKTGPVCPPGSTDPVCDLRAVQKTDCEIKGKKLADGESVTAYEAEHAMKCVSETRICHKGTLSGNFAHLSCQEGGAGPGPALGTLTGGPPAPEHLPPPPPAAKSVVIKELAGPKTHHAKYPRGEGPVQKPEKK